MKKTKLFMDTVVDIQVVNQKNASMDEVETKIEHAFDAFRKVEHACSRFSLDSELMKACQQIHTPVQISPYLFEPLKFALEMAKWTDGLFDPTIGKLMEDNGFNRHYLTGEVMKSSVASSTSYKDIQLDNKERTLCIKKPLVIDLGAVAKGFAIDLAANELKEFDRFMINAGGDLFGSEKGLDGDSWNIGIQHPYEKEKLIDTVHISNEAICTSGSYERKNKNMPGMHHLMNPKNGESPNDWVSCSVIAPFAMMADAFSTILFLSDEKSGKKLAEETGIKGMFVTPMLDVIKFGGM